LSKVDNFGGTVDKRRRTVDTQGELVDKVEITVEKTPEELIRD
jgi:hypothetical protein